MRLAVIVTEYPKTTETFILRDVLTFMAAGAEVRLYHLTPYRRCEILHDFAHATRAVAHSGPALLRRRPCALVRHAGRAGRALAHILRRQGTAPMLAAKSVALVPMSCAIAEDVAAWGAEHVHAEFAGHPATAAWIVGAVAGVPYSVSCRAHDIFRTQRLLAEKLGAASFVRTVSDYARHFLLQRVPSLDPERLHVIHSSVDVDAFADPGPPQREPWHVVYVGALQVRKGIDVLLRALADLGGKWRCSIAGDGPERQRLETLAAELGLVERVRFLGSQGFDAVVRLYAEANVVVAPSIIGPGGRTEGIPNVMIEALASRRPVISTNVSGIPELIRHRETGLLVAPGAVAELATALARVRDHPEEARTMAEAGRRHVEAEFALAVNARRQLDLFASDRRPHRSEAA